MRKLLWIISLVVLGSAGVTVADENHDEHNRSTVNLVGRTLFGGYLSDSGFAFLPLEQLACPATGTLTRMGKKTYALELLECGTFRLTIWNLQINGHGGDRGADHDGNRWELIRTDGSKVDRVFPPFDGGSLTAEIKSHTGCTPDGTFPFYNGTWDGKTLYISTHFQSPSCDGGKFWGQPWFWKLAEVDDPDNHLVDGLTPDDGPVHVTFSIEMYAVD